MVMPMIDHGSRISSLNTLQASKLTLDQIFESHCMPIVQTHGILQNIHQLGPH
ncbi:hypothetical protein LguiA_018043 [Lonicera macranthoides]